MSLATRCPACGTIFRVVQDQLKVSEGWVRCGQCHEVFHGIEALFDLDSDPAIAARRAARSAPLTAPSTRAFADNRANAPIPESEPPAAIVVPDPPAPPVAPAPRAIAPTPSPVSIRSSYQATGSRPLDNPAPPPPGFTPASGTPPANPIAPTPIPLRGIAPRFAARLAEESARAQAAPAPSPPAPSPIPSAFPDNVPAPWHASSPPVPAPPAWQTSSPIPAPTPVPAAWQAPAAEHAAPIWQAPAAEPIAPAWQPQAPVPAPQAWQAPTPIAAPEPAPWQAPAVDPLPAPDAWQAPPAPAPAFAPQRWQSPAPAPMPDAWQAAPAPGSAPSSWHAPTPTPTPTPQAPAWQPPLPDAVLVQQAWQEPAPAPAAQAWQEPVPPPAPWESPAPEPESWQAPTEWQEPTDFVPNTYNAPTEPMAFDPRPRDLPSPSPSPLQTPSPAPWSRDPSASELADDFAAPSPAPTRQPRTIVPKAADAADHAVDEPSENVPAAARRVPTPDIGGSTLPSMLAEDAVDEDEDNRAGPPTLASMLPEDAGEWPPRKKGRKEREVKSGSTELETVNRNDPRFLREAKSGARWRRPWVRAVLGASLAVLVVAAAGQLAWPQRDVLAARWPETLPAWTWLCEQADCRIEPPRALASLALDGSSLNRTDVEHVLLFSADLHNRADHEVRMPSFDLTFMDINGEVVSRKVLSPEQIGIHQAALAPDADLHVHARIQVGGLDASGFQAEMFYP